VSREVTMGERGLKRFIILVLVGVFLLSCLSAICRGASEADAQSTISDAQQKIVVCYNAVAEAAKAGANATHLLSVLDDAGNLLSNASVAYVNGDFDSARNLALQSQQTLSDFEAKAENLRTNAEQQASADFEVNIMGSVVGSIVVVVCALILWSTFKRRYGAGG
jgi:cobalamin biosynthesis Mg chelatase CobN